MFDFAPFRLDKPYDEQSVTTVRFPNGSFAHVAHSPNNWAARLGQIVASVALEMFLAES
jgi:hypothetical protein